MGGIMLWYEGGDISRILAMPRRGIICIDVETTGLCADRGDEILQLGIVDAAGATLLSGYVRPTHRKTWPAAQRVHGITPETVRGAPAMGDLLPKVDAALSRAELLVGYNLPFDMGFMRAAGARIPRCPRFDVMREFAPVVGSRRRSSGAYAWVPLATCARHYSVRLHAHDAFADACATMLCFQRMLEDDGSAFGGPGCVPYLEVVCRRGR